MKARDIFTPGRFPSYTFVDDHLVTKREALENALDTGSLLISVSGPSKSGKTVFIEEAIGKDKIVQVTGAGINSVDSLWKRVFDLLGTEIPLTQTKSASSTNGFSAKGSASGNIFVAKAGAELAANHASTDSDAITTSLAVDYLQLLIQELADQDFTVFIDDFHYIPRDVQSEIAKQIKEAIRSNVKFIVASVPYHADDVIRSNPDLRGRIVSIDFGYWDTKLLEKIAQKGFAELGITCDASMIKVLADQAAGSPQLMQYLCLNSCYATGAREKMDTTHIIPNDQSLLERICKSTVLSTDYSSVVDKMMEGPRVRGSDRISHALKDGSHGDVYSLLIKCLAIDPPQLTLRYDDLVLRVRSLCVSQTPSGSSITGACSHMAKIANDSAGENIIEWDGENDVLDIRDPYLLFYIRWGEIFS
ncbi:ATP-binding protein [Pseudomonas fortuita]|uniref:ATP-binding protein n=1 Tax=Pseudomonas fortuita TaxID=3233375 RepID=A0ACD4PC30_9PSED|nr:ATP-binding protein [Pseudomonas putida]WAP65492.1 ATP-binding protein [Pseudomonas putida]